MSLSEVRPLSLYSVAILVDDVVENDKWLEATLLLLLLLVNMLRGSGEAEGVVVVRQQLHFPFPERQQRGRHLQQVEEEGEEEVRVDNEE